jgi:hypothetical protein
MTPSPRAARPRPPPGGGRGLAGRRFSGAHSSCRGPAHRPGAAAALGAAAVLSRRRRGRGPCRCAEQRGPHGGVRGLEGAESVAARSPRGGRVACAGGPACATPGRCPERPSGAGGRRRHSPWPNRRRPPPAGSSQLPFPLLLLHVGGPRSRPDCRRLLSQIRRTSRTLGERARDRRRWSSAPGSAGFTRSGLRPPNRSNRTRPRGRRRPPDLGARRCVAGCRGSAPEETGGDSALS